MTISAGYPYVFSGMVNVTVPTYKGEVTGQTTNCRINGYDIVPTCYFSYTPQRQRIRRPQGHSDGEVLGRHELRTGHGDRKNQCRAKADPGVVFSFCNGNYVTTPGVPIQCSAYVFGNERTGAPIGQLTVIAPGYKGTITEPYPNACNGIYCSFVYTPKGRGYDTRKDVITATYSGDARYNHAKATITVYVKAAP